MNKVYNIFAKLWCQHNTVATMLITNMNEIVYASGVKQRDYKNKEQDKELFKKIRIIIFLLILLMMNYYSLLKRGVIIV